MRASLHFCVFFSVMVLLISVAQGKALFKFVETEEQCVHTTHIHVTRFITAYFVSNITDFLL